MKQVLFLAIVTLTLVSFKHKPAASAWKLVYVNTFTDLKGNDITAQMAPILGKRNEYFIDNNNYKAYNENNKLLYLYNSSTNIYYSVTNQIAQKIDATQITLAKPKVRTMPGKETIAGHECSAIEMETSSGTTVYYFTPSVGVNRAAYAKHNFGEWNAYLEATNGAVPLKMIYTDKKVGFIWTSITREVTKVSLTQKDFELPADVKVK